MSDIGDMAGRYFGCLFFVAIIFLFLTILGAFGFGYWLHG
jgi:uncharacterized membrane protein YdbT with pleckstrin-like domain